MAREKGSAKTGGRQMGTPNKKTMKLEQVLLQHDFDPVKELIGSIQASSAHDVKINAILKLMEYLYPKRKSIDISIDDESIAGNNKIDLDRLNMKELREMEALYIKAGGKGREVDPDIDEVYE